MSLKDDILDIFRGSKPNNCPWALITLKDNDGELQMSLAYNWDTDRKEYANLEVTETCQWDTTIEEIERMFKDAARKNRQRRKP